MANTIQFVPKSLPKNEASQGDKVESVLNKALELHALDVEADQSATGCMVIFWRQYDDGTAEESWLTSGLNQLEAVGILSKTIHDIQTFSIDGIGNEEGEGA